MTMNPGEVIKPPVNKDLAVQLIQDLYGLRAKNVKEFNSYDDKNYFFKSEEHENPHITGMNVKIIIALIKRMERKYILFLKVRFILGIHLALCEDGYVLKVTNWKDSEQDEFYDAQNEMILRLASAGLAMPV